MKMVKEEVFPHIEAFVTLKKFNFWKYKKNNHTLCWKNYLTWQPETYGIHKYLKKLSIKLNLYFYCSIIFLLSIIWKFHYPNSFVSSLTAILDKGHWTWKDQDNAA